MSNATLRVGAQIKSDVREYYFTPCSLTLRNSSRQEQLQKKPSAP
jgi:hypothetical protein